MVEIAGGLIFIGMIKLKHILTEAISDMVWHFTVPATALKIIEQNKFELSIGAGADTSKFAGKRAYFLSLARQKWGGYGDSKECRIQLDGRKLSQKYKGGAFDYWGTGPKGSEFEDRLYSFEPSIPNAKNYIVQVDVFFDPVSSRNPKFISKVMDACLEKNILCFLYRNKRDYQAGRNGEKVTKELADSMRPITDPTEQPYVSIPKNPDGLDRLVYMAKVVGITEDEITKVFMSNEQAKKDYTARISQLEPDERKKYGTYEDWINTGLEKYKKEEWKLKDVMTDRYHDAHGVIHTEIRNAKRHMDGVDREILILIYRQARKDNVTSDKIIPYIIDRAKKKYDEENK